MTPPDLSPETGAEPDFFQLLDQPAVIMRQDATLFRANTAFERHFGAWKAGMPFVHGMDEQGQEALQRTIRTLGDAPASFIHAFRPDALPARRWSWQLWRQSEWVFGRARPAGQMPDAGLMFQALFSSPAIGIAILDEHGQLVEVNESFSELLGCARDELLHTRGMDWVHRPDRKAVSENEGQLSSGKISRYRLTVRLKKRNSRLVWVMLTVNPIQRITGERQFLVTTENIDQRVKAERKLVQRAEELVRSNKDLEQFAYMASHDLQQPLRTISNFVQLLDRKYASQLNEEAREFIRYAVEGSTRMQQMIRDLLAYSRVQRLDLELEFVDFNEVMEEVNTNLQEVAQASTANVLSEYLPALRASRRQMVQLFQNLIENAIKFSRSEQRPEVIISADDQESKVRFSVRDNGIGIAEEHRDRIFALFQRLHEQGTVQGTGIGLAICQKIVENHGGKIWVESEPGKGSVFYFTVRKAADKSTT
ncbi:MAG: PAS domain S-box protein [Bacteroidetes bacterium]|nr:PAS domain S-box protein [Bacteroidota bacterium]